MRVTFGQYKGQHVDVLLDDEDYCHWLLNQPWFSRHTNIWAAVKEVHGANHVQGRSAEYTRGWKDGHGAVWTELRDEVLRPHEYSLFYALAYCRWRGCNCDRPVWFCKEHQAVHDGHADECPYYIEEQRKKRVREQREAKQAQRREEQRCKATRNDGQPCRGWRHNDSPYCWPHRNYKDEALAAMTEAAERDGVDEAISAQFVRYLAGHEWE